MSYTFIPMKEPFQFKVEGVLEVMPENVQHWGPCSACSFGKHRTWGLSFTSGRKGRKYGIHQSIIQVHAIYEVVALRLTLEKVEQLLLLQLRSSVLKTSSSPTVFTVSGNADRHDSSFTGCGQILFVLWYISASSLMILLLDHYVSEQWLIVIIQEQCADGFNGPIIQC